MIKKFLLLLICSTFFCLKAQTTEEAIQFLKVNCYNWACERIAYGGFKTRLEISLMENDKYLKLRVKMPDYPFNPGGYTIVKINLSYVTQISIEQSSDCSGINIQTKPMGIEIEWYSNEGVILKNNEYWKAHLEKTGWVDDSIRIRAQSDESRGPERIVNTLKFLAQRNGAVMTESHF
jgi:hypothetical protein